ncbi:MAG: hypothetical protein A2Y57_04270 [Candidatus Woykebacteria bacterium RBG_13_40_7b]|uniref:Cohesin domain-containing protein n=1 Tax=Candidatus Woykebacteria bacterium RBG_13_40_7b TaxID=1802594 RepID=A0A1G1W8H1_9BACT|nr:MAG: hypothetical protein A2Y57_04270 [Candidatus Woykebacteria bacterium RBG_13_40_7b]
MISAKSLVVKGLVVLSFSILALFILVSRAHAATLSLSPSSGTVGEGYEFKVQVIVDTQGVQTDGTDVFLFYDDDKLTLTSSDITQGSFYSLYPTKTVSAGVIKIDAQANTGGPYPSGKGTVATLNFTAKAQGAGAVEFDFTEDSTTDSNVVEHGTSQDVLVSVTDGSYTIGAASVGAGTLGGTSSSGTGATDLPETGFVLPTYGIVSIGILLLGVGIYLLRRRRVTL